MKHLQVITWCRWSLADFYDRRYCTHFTASVLRPSFEYPIAACSMSIVKGDYRVFMRFQSIEEMGAHFVIPEAHMPRLKAAFSEAQGQAELIQEHQRCLHKMSDLAPNSYVVRTDSGEIIAEAERILDKSGGK